MSSFKCEKCGKCILDSPAGYTTGCEHYPLEYKEKIIVCNPERELLNENSLLVENKQDPTKPYQIVHLNIHHTI